MVKTLRTDLSSVAFRSWSRGRRASPLFAPGGDDIDTGAVIRNWLRCRFREAVGREQSVFPNVVFGMI